MERAINDFEEAITPTRRARPLYQEELDIIYEPAFIGEPEDYEPRIIELEYTRKFVAGLVYCSNVKKTYYAITYEPNSIDREIELLDAIESETSDRCSEIRDYHGYSQSDGFFDIEYPVYPEIDIGEE